MTCRRRLGKKRGIFCNTCNRGVHKTETCSGMKRKQVEDISKKKVKWKYDGCKGILANPYPKPDNKQVEYVTGKGSGDIINELKIIQWNADAYLSKKEEFANMVLEMDIDIFVIQETKMIMVDKKPEIPGYEIKRRDRPQHKGNEDNRGGGLITGIKDTIPVTELKNDLRGEEDELTEWLTIEIPTRGKESIRITNMYIPETRDSVGERRRNRKKKVVTTKWPCARGDVILGDLNAHSAIWDNAVIQRPALQKERGDMIEQWLTETEMVCLNDGRPTRNARQADHLDTAPDLSIVHASLIEKFTWETIDATGSDHKPILITYKDGFEITKVNNKPRFKWRLTKGDWEKFTKEIEDEMPECPELLRTELGEYNTNAIEKKFSDTVIRAAKKHIKKKKINARTRVDLGEEVKKEAAHRNQLRKDIVNNREEWVESSRKVAEMVKEERGKKWTEYVENINPKTASSKVWSTIRNLEGKNKQQGKSDTLVVENKAYITDKDKANQFAKTYKGFSRLPTRKEDRAL